MGSPGVAWQTQIIRAACKVESDPGWDASTLTSTLTGQDWHLALAPITPEWALSFLPSKRWIEPSAFPWLRLEFSVPLFAMSLSQSDDFKLSESPIKPVLNDLYKPDTPTHIVRTL